MVGALAKLLSPKEGSVKVERGLRSPRFRRAEPKS
jgi:hypothetical protein